MFTDREHNEVKTGDIVNVGGRKGRVESEMSQNVCVRLEDGSLITPKYVDVLFDSSPVVHLGGSAKHGPLMTEEDIREQARKEMDLLAARQKKVEEHVIAPQQREEQLNQEAKATIEINKELAKEDTKKAEEALKVAESIQAETPEQVEARLRKAATQDPAHTPNPTTTPNKPGAPEQPKPAQPAPVTQVAPTPVVAPTPAVVQSANPVVSIDRVI